jgi:hypothetical protein
MNQPNDVEELEDRAVAELEQTDLLLPLILRQSVAVTSPTAQRLVVVGELIAIKEQGQIPLVLYPGQKGSAAVPARSIVDLHASQIGRRVLLLFETNENADPIVIGLLREGNGLPAKEMSTQVEVQADGNLVTVSARKRLVLRCGRASITLTEEGKILIQGTYVSSRSSGVHRIKGGSVQIN